ncbi:MAG: DUF427 domain-containing protein [Actinomycetota bacterium]|nr:DUF427 domain-containing protein [Actinomycetota bacterium]
MQAIWNDTVVAESDRTIVVEGNHYFPEDSLRKECFVESRATSICPWKGKASYVDLAVDGQTNPSAAWQDRHPLPSARRVRNRVAFWHGVQVVPARDDHEASEPPGTVVGPEDRGAGGAGQSS